MPAYDGHYVSNADIRAEGVTTSMASDGQCDIAIKAAERFIETKTNRWFYRRTAMTLVLDGGDHFVPYFGIVGTTDILNLSVPILNITDITIFDIVQDVGNFIVFNRIGPPKDDRWNPRIISKYHFWPTDGVQNITIKGDFGFVEDTASYTTPEDIRIAARKLAIIYLPIFKMINPERDADKKSDFIITEQLPGNGYSAEYTKSYDTLIREYTGDSEIDEIIETYRYKFAVMAV